jgi:hypothetical protein
LADEEHFVDIGATVPIKEVVTVDGSTPMWMQHEGGTAQIGDTEYRFTSAIAACHIIVYRDGRAFIVKIDDVIGALHHKLTEGEDDNEQGL